MTGQDGARPFAPWEDGEREPTGPGHLEWWYFDAQFTDGGTVAVTVATKPPGGDVSPPLRPTVRVQYVSPEGVSTQVQPEFPAEWFAAQEDRCDVRIGPNHISGDLRTYQVVTRDPQVSLDLTFTATVPCARIGTGRKLLGPSGQHAGWVVPLPRADVTGTVVVGGDLVPVAGEGYHDHNWYDTGFREFLQEWYWGRGQFGDDTIIFGAETSRPAAGGVTLPFMIFSPDGRMPIRTDRDGAVTVDDWREEDGERIPDRLRFDWHDPDSADEVGVELTGTHLLRGYAEHGMHYRRLSGNATLRARIGGEERQGTNRLIFEHTYVD
ncbi:lipocalin-like domain-containing protein [Dactylosporangium sp. NPDC005572]|uniref:lipocalin-like domain-containing protein n=1 Tax=Dactylosporangium sp. NPDC005572 TaxID=3156889 RepID=UPI0033A361C8